MLPKRTANKKRHHPNLKHPNLFSKPGIKSSSKVLGDTEKKLDREPLREAKESVHSKSLRKAKERSEYSKLLRDTEESVYA